DGVPNEAGTGIPAGFGIPTGGGMDGPAELTVFLPRRALRSIFFLSDIVEFGAGVLGETNERKQCFRGGRHTSGRHPQRQGRISTVSGFAPPGPGSRRAPLIHGPTGL